MPQQVVVASTNPVKINAVKLGFTDVFPHHTFIYTPTTVPSNVSVQPMTDEETLTGAINRVNKSQALYPDSAFWVGLEGGIHKIQGIYHSFAWVAIIHQDQLEISRTSTFSLPQKVSNLIDQGIELGFAMDQAYQVKNVKHTTGAIGILTHNLITRTTLYQPAVVIALSRLITNIN